MKQTQNKRTNLVKFALFCSIVFKIMDYGNQFNRIEIIKTFYPTAKIDIFFMFYNLKRKKRKVFICVLLTRVLHQVTDPTLYKSEKYSMKSNRIEYGKGNLENFLEIITLLA